MPKSFLILSIFISFFANAQKKQMARALYELGQTYERYSNTEKSIESFNRCLQVSSEIKDSTLIAYSLDGLANIYKNNENIPKALEFLIKSEKIKTATHDGFGLTFTYSSFSEIYESQNDYTKALEYSYKCLRIMNDSLLHGRSSKDDVSHFLCDIGFLHIKQQDYTKALKAFTKALQLSKEYGENKQSIAFCHYYLGEVNLKLSNFDVALDWFEKGLNISQANDDKAGIAYCFSDLGELYIKKNEYNIALDYYNKALKLYEETASKEGAIYSLNKMSNIYFKRNDFNSASLYSLKSLQLSKEIGFPKNIQDVAKQLYTVYKKQNNSTKALQMHELYIQMRDSINNKESQKNILKKQFQYEYEKKVSSDSLKVSEERKINKLNAEKEQSQRYFLYIGLIVVIVFSGFMFKKYRETQAQKLIIEKQKHLVEEKHKEITDSINYAERIQRSLLASEELLNENLKESFVFFKPKDVVSGDFYWATKLSNNQFAMVTADSTGHGVPGAIMSILNISCLKETVKEGFTEPSEILNHTRNKIIEILKKDGSIEGGKDGMDCSLVCFDFTKDKLTYSAANNPIWIVRGKQIMEFSPDKMPVGKHDRDTISFSQHQIELQKNDMVYTLTDGMPDQFGGPKGKKYMYKQLKELLISISDLSMNEQKEKITESLNSWIGEIEQVDDITIIGIKV